MSHAYAEVDFPDGTVLIGVYDTISSTAVASLYKTVREADAGRKEPIPAGLTCTCGERPEPVEFWSPYGNGVSFETTACRRCLVITGPQWEQSDC